MSALFVAVSLPYLRAHAGRLLLTVLGVIIGVQGMVAMGALNHSIVRSFQAGVDTIAGSASLQVAGPATGIPETLVAEVQAVPGVAEAVPLIQGTFETATAPPERIAIFGVDLLESAGRRSPQFPREHVHIDDELIFLSAADSIALGAPLLNRLGTEVGAEIALVTPAGTRTFTVRGVLDPVGPMKLFEGSVALLDLASAQRFLLAPGLVQTIYVTPDPDVPIDEVRHRLASAIGTRARVERTTVRGEQVEAMLGSLRVALSLANLVTMIVAFFIIYQTVSIAVEQRRREIAIARSLGFTRRSIAGLFLSESLILGIVGAIGGVVGGYALARISLRAAIAGVSEVYQRVAMAELHLPAAETLVAIIFGVGTCLFAGVAPALIAAREPPAQVLRSVAGTRSERSSRTWRAIVGIVLLPLAIFTLSICPRLDSTDAKVAWTMLGHTLLIAGTAVLAPIFVATWAAIGLRFGAHASLPVGLATEFFSRRPTRAASTVSAIMVGYLLVLVLGSVVLSMNESLGRWLSTLIPADMVVGMPPGLDGGTFDQALAREIAALEDVRSVERHRKGVALYAGRPVVLVAFDRKGRPDGEALSVLSSRPGAYDAVEAGSAVFVSESFAFRFDKQIGDAIDLETADGRTTFLIVGIVREYAFDLGTILVDIDIYQRHWRDHGLTHANIFPAKAADLPSLRARIATVAREDPRVAVISNDEFRADIQDTIDRLLSVLGSLRLFACAIAMLGVITFLLAAVVDRRREIGVLRSIGVTRVQIRRAIMIEAAMLGFAGACLGLLAGFVASYYMVTHSIRVDMGWTLDFTFPLGLAISTLGAITLTAALAGYFPARQFTTQSILTGLQTE